MKRVEVNCLLAFALLFIVDSISISIAKAKKECAVTQDVADEATKKLFFFGDRDAVFPTNESQIDDYCKMIYLNVKTLTQYAKCLKPFPKTVIGLTVQGYKKVAKKRCVDKSWRKAFMKLGTCVTRKNLSENFHICTDKAIIADEYIVNRLPVKDHVLMSCCVSVITKQCFLQQGVACGKISSEFGFQLMNEPSADSLDLICSTYNSIETCIAKYGDYMKKIIEYIKKTRKPTQSLMSASMKSLLGHDILE